MQPIPSGGPSAAGSITCARLQRKDTDPAVDALATQAPPWRGGREFPVGLRMTRDVRDAPFCSTARTFPCRQESGPRPLIQWARTPPRCACAFQVPDEDFLSPPQTRKLGEAIISHSRGGMSLGNITWAKFPDGFPNIFVHDVDKLKVFNLFSLNPFPRPHPSLPLQSPGGIYRSRSPAEHSLQSFLETRPSLPPTLVLDRCSSLR
jgi:hypothetical protein